MDEQALANLQQQLVSRVPLCPAAFATASLRQAATKFFGESEVWKYTTAAQALTAGTASYPITLAGSLAAGVDVWRINAGYNQGALIGEGTYTLDYQEIAAVPPATDPTWGYFFIFETDYVPTATVAGALTIEVVLAPSERDGYVSPFMWQKWYPAILAGAQTMMYASRTRPWFDPVAAAVAREDYAVQLALARRELNQQFSFNGELRANNPGGWL
jgi:hypothetical protein